MTNEDYIDILRTLRMRLRKLGLGDLEDRISSNLRGHDGPYWELIYFLKAFREEMYAGSNEQYQALLKRFNDNVNTESGNRIAAIRIQLTQGDAERY